MKLTRKGALEESIAIWKYLSKTGDLNKPDVLTYKYIRGCPLCHLFFKLDCSGCFLESEEACSPEGCYVKWYYAKTKATKRKYAKQMLNTLRRCYKHLIEENE